MIIRKRLDHPQMTLPQILVGGEQVVQRLRTLAASAGPSANSSLFYTRIRGKTLDSINAKIAARRRAKHGSSYSFRDITDYTGFRIVTLYDGDMLKGIDFILEILQAGQSLSDPIFSRGNIFLHFYDGRFNARTESPFASQVEVSQQSDIYYKCARHFLDRVHAYCQDRHVRTAAALEVEPSTDHICKYVLEHCTAHAKTADRYSSAHLTFWANSYHPNSVVQPIPIEFQIRTAIEDVWAEVSHKLLYKSREAFIWSRAYEDNFTRAYDLSNSLKDRMNTLPTDLAGIYESAMRARSIAHDFWGDKEKAPAWNERYTDLDYSLCASLISLAGDGVLPREILEPLKHCEVLLRTVSRHASETDNAAILGKCIYLLSELASRISDDHMRTAELDGEGVPVDAGSRLYAQRKMLTELETVRLRILLAINYKHRYTDGRVSVFNNEEDRKQTLMLLYSEMCKFIDQRPLKLKPMTMLHFWKYMLADEAENWSLARLNLELAYASMSEDLTLPYWSIYRVLIPSFLAGELRREVDEIIKGVEKLKAAVRMMPSVRSVLREKLSDAIKYAMDAFEEHVDTRDHKQNRRGDLLFDADFVRPITEAHLVISITRMLYDKFELFIGRNRPSIQEKMWRIIQYIEHNESEFDFLIKRDQSSIEVDVKRIKSLLTSEVV